MAAVQPKKVTGGAFGRYMAEHRAELMKECAGNFFPFQGTWQSIKLGSERFKALGASAKAKYEQMYADAKHQYEKDLAAFLAAGGVKAAPKSKKNKEKKAKKDPNKPKQPAGGAWKDTPSFGAIYFSLTLSPSDSRATYDFLILFNMCYPAQ